MEIRIGEDIGAYVFDPVAKTITITGIAPILIGEIVHILRIDPITEDISILYDGVTGATILNNVITLTTSTVGMASTDKLDIFVNSATIVTGPSLSEETNLFFEDLTVYSNNFKALLKTFETDSFNISEDGLYKIEISVELTNIDDEKGCEVYNYLDDNPSNMILKLLGIVSDSMEYHIESNFKFIQLTKGTHSITTYIESTENNKTAYMKNYQLLISKV